MRLTTANTSIGKLTWTRPIAYKLRKAIVCMRPGRLVVITHLHCGARLAELTILQVARLQPWPLPGTMPASLRVAFAPRIGVHAAV